MRSLSNVVLRWVWSLKGKKEKKKKSMMVNLNEWCCPLIHNMEGILSMWEKGKKEVLVKLSGVHRAFGAL